MEAGALSNPVLRARRNLADRIGDPLLRGLSGLAAALAIAAIAGIAYEVIRFAGKHANNAIVRAVLAPGLCHHGCHMLSPALGEAAARDGN